MVYIREREIKGKYRLLGDKGKISTIWEFRENFINQTPRAKLL